MHQYERERSGFCICIGKTAERGLAKLSHVNFLVIGGKLKIKDKGLKIVGNVQSLVFNHYFDERLGCGDGLKDGST